MAELAQNPATTLQFRVMLFRELAQYVAPKCRAIEITDDQENFQHCVTVHFVGADDRECEGFDNI
jgi:hypothetical protein